MERLKGYGKKIVSLMCAVMIVSIGIFSTSFDSYAAVNNFYLGYPEPATSESQGYVSILFHGSDGVVKVMTFFWSCYAVNNGVTSPAEMRVQINNNKVNFNLFQLGATGGFYSLSYITSVGRYRLGVNTNSSDYTYDLGAEGCTICGWRVGGNGFVEGFWNSLDFSLFYSEDGSVVLLQEIIEVLTSNGATLGSVLLYVDDILDSVDGVESQLSSVINYLKSIDSELDSIKSELQKIYNKADEILNEQKKSNTWLGKIWDSIQEFINPSDNDSQKINKYNSETNTQKSEIDGLNEQNQVGKVDVNSATSQVDSNINYENMAQYGGVLATITNNQYILQLILVVVSVVIISYVLFGKR